MSIKEILNKVYREGRSRKSFEKGNMVKDQALKEIEALMLSKRCPLIPQKYQYIKIGSRWINDREYEVEILDLGEHEIWLLYLENEQRCSWEYEKFFEQYKPVSTLSTHHNNKL